MDKYMEFIHARSGADLEEQDRLAAEILREGLYTGTQKNHEVCEYVALRSLELSEPGKDNSPKKQRKRLLILDAVRYWKWWKAGLIEDGLIGGDADPAPVIIQDRFNVSPGMMLEWIEKYSPMLPDAKKEYQQCRDAMPDLTDDPEYNPKAQVIFKMENSGRAYQYYSRSGKRGFYRGDFPYSI